MCDVIYYVINNANKKISDWLSVLDVYYCLDLQAVDWIYIMYMVICLLLADLRITVLLC